MRWQGDRQSENVEDRRGMTPQELVYRNRLSPEWRAIYEERVAIMVEAGLPADLAEAAAVVLREAGHAGRTYVLTGPAQVSPRQRSTAIGQALRQ